MVFLQPIFLLSKTYQDHKLFCILTFELSKKHKDIEGYRKCLKRTLSKKKVIKHDVK